MTLSRYEIYVLTYNFSHVYMSIFLITYARTRPYALIATQVFIKLSAQDPLYMPLIRALHISISRHIEGPLT